MVGKGDTFVFVSKTLICAAYVDDFLFWECLQSKIDKVLKSFKEYGLSYNW